MMINERIFHLLDKQNKTAKDLGKFIGVNASSISAWKNEGSFPSSKYIIGFPNFLMFLLNIYLQVLRIQTISRYLKVSKNLLIRTTN